MHEPKILGRRLAEARKLRGLTQEDVADAAGVTGSTVSQWESGGVTPTLINLVAANTVLRVRLDWLFYGVGDLSAEAVEFAERFEHATPEDRERMKAAVLLALPPPTATTASPFRSGEPSSRKRKDGTK